MNIDTHSVVATSKDSVKIGCTTVSRQEAQDVIALMDSYMKSPKTGDIMRYEKESSNYGTFTVVVTGRTTGAVISSSNRLHSAGTLSEGWNWETSPHQWTNLGQDK